MLDVDQLFSKTVAEIEKMLSTKTVVGEPIKIDGYTLVPLLSVGFGFAAAGGDGTDSKKAGGHGGGAGGGGGVKPVAVVIVGPDGVRVDTVKGSAASVVDKAIETIGAAVAGRKASEASSA